MIEAVPNSQRRASPIIDPWDKKPAFQLLDALLEPEIAALRALVGEHPVYRLYLEAGLAAARKGQDRTVLRGRDEEGLAFGIRFDGLAIRTIVGRLGFDEVAAVADIESAAELHLDAVDADRLEPMFDRRLEARRELRYYRLDGPPNLAPDESCRRLRADDFDRVRHFFGTIYSGTIFSRWMLDLPFFGLFDAEEELIACGGAVAMADGLANIGNFLTRPDHRGEGLAQILASTLATALRAEGIRTLTLGTNADNPAACRAYERVGFTCFETRTEIDLSARPSARGAA